MVGRGLECVFGENRSRNETIGTESRDFLSVLVDLYGWMHCEASLGRRMAFSLGSISEVKGQGELFENRLTVMF